MINNQLPYADSIDGEVVEDTAAKELVIPTQREAPGRQPALPRGGQPQPILAPWMKDRAEFIYKMQDVGKRAAHILGWHLCHAPANALRVLWFAFRTLCFIVVGASRWVFDLDGGRIHELSHEDYFKEKKLRDQRREDRAKIAGFVLGAVVVTVLIVWWWTPAWVSWGLLVCVVVVLALIGRPRDKPFIMPATIAPGEDTPLTADVVFETLCSLGIPKMTKPQDLQLLYAVKPSRASVTGR
jgi:DNA segregation ATPase FtsK/SpoIIIE, S-DNA-T family